uniref:Uncharacterized protein n=1 Tax=Timema cristinae TaxID=61476 RepID=A0A7R9D6U0_TIMCR|nr:unnamed protein product [Timema cristinae]
MPNNTVRTFGPTFLR